MDDVTVKRAQKLLHFICMDAPGDSAEEKTRHNKLRVRYLTELKALSTDRKQYASLIRADVPSTLLSLVSSPIQSDVLLAALSVIANLCCDRSVRKALGPTTVPRLLDIIRVVQDKSVRARALRALTNLGEDSAHVSVMSNQQSMGLLVTLLQRHLPPWESMFQDSHTRDATPPSPEPISTDHDTDTELPGAEMGGAEILDDKESKDLIFALARAIFVFGQSIECRQAIDTSAVIPLLLAVFCFTTSDTMAAQVIKDLALLVDANQEHSKTAFKDIQSLDVDTVSPFYTKMYRHFMDAPDTPIGGEAHLTLTCALRVCEAWCTFGGVKARLKFGTVGLVQILSEILKQRDTYRNERNVSLRLVTRICEEPVTRAKVKASGALSEMVRCVNELCLEARKDDNIDGTGDTEPRRSALALGQCVQALASFGFDAPSLHVIFHRTEGLSDQSLSYLLTLNDKVNVPIVRYVLSLCVHASSTPELQARFLTPWLVKDLQTLVQTGDAEIVGSVSVMVRNLITELNLTRFCVIDLLSVVDILEDNNHTALAIQLKQHIGQLSGQEWATKLLEPYLSADVASTQFSAALMLGYGIPYINKLNTENATDILFNATHNVTDLLLHTLSHDELFHRIRAAQSLSFCGRLAIQRKEQMEAHLGYPRRARRCKNADAERDSRKRSISAVEHISPRPLLIPTHTYTITKGNTVSNTCTPIESDEVHETENGITDTDTVTFIVGGRPLCVSRSALMNTSEYYAHMLGGHFLEAHKAVFQVDDVEYDVFYALMAYLLPDLRPIQEYVETVLHKEKTARLCHQNDASSERITTATIVGAADELGIKIVDDKCNSAEDLSHMEQPVATHVSNKGVIEAPRTDVEDYKVVNDAEVEPNLDIDSRLKAFVSDRMAYSEWFASQQDLMTVIKLASVADRFLLTELRDKCVERAWSSLDSTFAPQSYTVAKELGVEELEIDSIECFLLNLIRVAKGGTQIFGDILDGVRLYFAKYLLHLI